MRLGAQYELATPNEARDLPHDAVVLRFVFGFALAGALGDLGGVERGGNADHDVGGEEFVAVVGLDGDAVFDFGGADFAYDGVDFEGEVDVFGGAVAHQFEFAVGGHEGDGAVGVELAELDALVELAVFQRDGAGGGAGGFLPRVLVADCVGVGARLGEEELVVEPEFAFGRAAEVCTHDNLAVDVRAQDGPRCAHKKVHVLDHVHERFVLSIFDIPSSPGLCTCCLHCDLRGIAGGGCGRSYGGG